MTDAPPVDLRLRLILVTDGIGDPGRLEEIVLAAIAGGVRCVQLREPNWTARQLLRTCQALRPALDGVNGLLLVNDRLDVALAGAAHGAQIGHRSLPPQLARRVLGPDLVLGYSAHDLEELQSAAEHGCDFALLSPVWQTSSKPGSAFLSAQRAGRLTAAAGLPVVWLGGVHSENMTELASVTAAERPVGVAVRSGIMLAENPQAAARELLSAWPAE